MKRSRYGLGAFAGEDIKANDLIGGTSSANNLLVLRAGDAEYIGELLDDSEEALVHRYATLRAVALHLTIELYL